ncbi:MAG: hypothetical protein JW965_00760 [Bacteroidales bacterium]|nr:hypothetical protein [Bacteroidales bacterium]
MSNPVPRLKAAVSQNFINIPGWRTRRKIVVIESDDWGSIRMPSNEVYSKFVAQGLAIAGSDYNRLDTLESNEDMTLLYEILNYIKDSTGKHPVITANFVVGNPDFKMIKKSDFTEYHFEPVTETLKRYPGRERVEFLWKQGNNTGIFRPQFHGREHVNVVRWMNALRTRAPEMMFTFNNETTFSGNGDYNFMEVLDYNTPDDLLKMKESLAEGLDLFEDIFGFRSRSFIPPCYTWNSDVEETLHEKGVRYIQGLVIQSIPTGSFGNYTKKYHFLGNRNNYGQYFLIRNVFFEPSLTKSSDNVGECLRRINIAFRWRKPAIISAHRINFIGTLDERNRSENLKLLKDLLERIIKLWPDVEFMSSDQLGDLIASTS